MDHTPPDDIEQLLKLSWHHRERVAAISQLLFEEELRHSSAGEAAKEARKAEAEEDEQVLLENEQINAEIAKKRELRLQKEHIEQEEKIRQDLRDFDKQETIKHRELQEFIKEETKILENRIKLEDLEKAIETALENPTDYEFAIDSDGHIFRGRETKSIHVPKNALEKIPQPVKESEKLLRDYS